MDNAISEIPNAALGARNPTGSIVKNIISKFDGGEKIKNKKDYYSKQQAKSSIIQT